MTALDTNLAYHFQMTTIGQIAGACDCLSFNPSPSICGDKLFFLSLLLAGRLHTVHDYINQTLYDLSSTRVDMLTFGPYHLIRLRC